MQARKRPPPQAFAHRANPTDVRPIAASRTSPVRAYAAVAAALLLGAPLAACTETFGTRLAGAMPPTVPATATSVEETPTDQIPGTSPTTSATPTIEPTNVPVPGGAQPVMTDDVSLKPSCPLKKAPHVD